MTKWLAIFMACLALGLVAVGCGDDDDDEGGGDAAETTEQPEPKPAAKSVEVAMKDIAFDPASVTVTKGSTITWTNDDSVGHDVTKTGGVGPEFSSGDPGGMKQGDTYEETVNTVGEIEYVCTVHPNMTGTITVTE